MEESIYRPIHEGSNHFQGCPAQVVQKGGLYGQLHRVAQRHLNDPQPDNYPLGLDRDGGCEPQGVTINRLPNEVVLGNLYCVES